MHWHLETILSQRNSLPIIPIIIIENNYTLSTKTYILHAKQNVAEPR